MRRILLSALLSACVCVPLAVTARPATTASHDQTVGQQREGTLSWSQAKRDADFRRMYRIFPSIRVDAGAHVHALPQGKPLELANGADTTTWIRRYMRRYHIAGVMVLQDGDIRLQRYAMGFGPNQRWTSYSVAKSVTSLLLGAALQQGYIHSMDDPVDRYLPLLRHTAYADVTVRELLTMTTGVAWNEDYADPHSDVAQMYLGSCVDHRAQALNYLLHKPRKYPPGTHWHYNTAQVDLLGTLIQKATHRSLAVYLSQVLWKPYGMAKAAWWIRDGCDTHENTGGSGLSATLADYARIGEFMLDGAQINGKQVVSARWYRGAIHREASTGKKHHGYGYLWWTSQDDSYAAYGIFGQMVYIDPRLRLVIAKLGAWPQATSKQLDAAQRKFVATIKRAVRAYPEEPRQKMTARMPVRRASATPGN